jgi:hypothetical protein
MVATGRALWVVALFTTILASLAADILLLASFPADSTGVTGTVAAVASSSIVLQIPAEE